MKLSQVLEGLNPTLVKGSTEIDVPGVCQDSRHFQAGELYIAIKGTQFNGHFFVAEASQRGACALVVEDERVVPISFGGTVVRVQDTRRALDAIAANFYENPSDRLYAVGITGTNGKTTTSVMVEHVL